MRYRTEIDRRSWTQQLHFVYVLLVLYAACLAVTNSTVYKLTTSEVSRMKVFENIFFKWFWYVSDVICCYVLFMAWFCCYDFDMVSVMILMWFQLWFLMWVKLVIWSQPIGTIQNIAKSYQNHIKIVSKPYQNRIKSVSKSYQNHVKTTKTFDKSTKNLSLGCFCFFVWSQLTGTISKPYQNHIKIVSKSYQKHIKIISKS